jgi:polar amino acid transport system substrate-binding protein
LPIARHTAAVVLNNLRTVFVALAIGSAGAALAQTQQPVAAPSFWDANRRLPRPDMTGLTRIRFLTDDDYPPFHFAQADGTLAGFNVDLARAICEELKLACTIQARRWDNLAPALEAGEGDAIIASLAIDGPNAERFDFTAPYYLTPGRFVVLRGARAEPSPTPEALKGQRVATLEGGAHERFLRAYFKEADIRPYASNEIARAALAAGDVDLIFGDAVTTALWLASPAGAACCAFRGGPFYSRAYFGAGAGVAVAKNNAALRKAIDFALANLSARGVYAELYLKHFPVAPH